MKDVAVLLTCYNRKEETLNCLSKLYSNLDINNNFKIQVFLVDDGCTDGTYEAVKSLYPKILIIGGDGNLFWNRGMNLAWKEAAKTNPDYYLWLNDDTFLFENCINSLLESSFEKENRAIIVGTTKSAVNDLLTYGGRKESIELIQPCVDLQECYHFNGNVVLIPKSVFQIVGYLDNTFHHAIGDFDYGLRARKLKIRLFVSSTINGICERHGSFPKWCAPERPIIERLEMLYASTCDCNPKQLFVFNKRHYGYIKAFSAIISVHLRLLFPATMNKKIEF